LTLGNLSHYNQNHNQQSETPEVPDGIKKQQTGKNSKPYTDFPLTLHQATGQWCKKIKGKIYYFGKDPDAALKKYLDERDDLQAGKKPRAYN